MLKSLEIKNFRTFSHLVVQCLGRVNLVVGKNNVGKTTLLEALRLYGSLWPARTVSAILFDRDEVTGEPGEAPRLLLHSLFHGRSVAEGTTASIGPTGPEALEETLQIRAEVETSMRASTTTTPAPWSSSGIQGPFLLSFGMLLLIKMKDRQFQLSADRSVGYQIPSRSIKPPEVDSGPTYLRGLSIAASANETARRWDGIALTAGEHRVLNALRMIAPISGVSFVEDPREQGRRMAKARVDGLSEPIPLAALGDGVVRMFQIAVALEYAAITRTVASEADLPGNVFPMLLIDEVEMGIHYSLHADLWRFIFRAANDLGVQVFATTHSWDCIEGFQEAAAEHASEGALIRLEAGRGRSRAVVFSEDELSIVTREQIEVR